jgi:hypothetical protein
MKMKFWKITTIIGIIFLCYFLMSYIIKARNAADMVNCNRQMRELALAFNHYYRIHQALPHPHEVKKNKLHSWRILIFEGFSERIVDDFDFNSDWNSSKNTIAISELTQHFFSCPYCQRKIKKSRILYSNYVGIVTQSGNWFTSFSDDYCTADQVLLVICDKNSMIQTAEPRDITLSDAWSIWSNQVFSASRYFIPSQKNNFGIFWDYTQNCVICREYTDADLQTLGKLQGLNTCPTPNEEQNIKPGKIDACFMTLNNIL